MNEMSNIEILDIRICEPFTLRLRSDGILHSHIASYPDFSVDSLKRFNRVMGDMVGFRKVPLLVTLDDFAIPPYETREFWAQKGSCPWSKADAFIAGNVGHQLIGRLYLSFNKPDRPTKIFSNIGDAVSWLRKFL